jgi:hypothetical protein
MRAAAGGPDRSAPDIYADGGGDTRRPATGATCPLVGTCPIDPVAAVCTSGRLVRGRSLMGGPRDVQHRLPGELSGARLWRCCRHLGRRNRRRDRNRLQLHGDARGRRRPGRARCLCWLASPRATTGRLRVRSTAPRRLAWRYAASGAVKVPPESADLAELVEGIARSEGLPGEPIAGTPRLPVPLGSYLSVAPTPAFR